MTDVELTGNLTINELSQRASWMLGEVHAQDFADINELYLKLRERGTLTLRDATLNISEPANDERFFLAMHKLRLHNSAIYLNSSRALLVVNELESTNSSFRSFPPNVAVAKQGADGKTPGANGEKGGDGMDGASCLVFITDKIRTPDRIEVILTGQHGGRGGSGAPGAKGAKGHDGRNCKAGHTDHDCRSGCGDGGPGSPGQKGGDGGNGGGGGPGGSTEFRLHGTSPVPNYMVGFNGDGGMGGNPGYGTIGGEGGDGGSPGKSACRGCHSSCNPGPAGPRGSNGVHGKSGNPGRRGTGRTSTFEVPYLKTVLASFFPNAHKGLWSPAMYEVSSGVSESLPG